MKTNKDKPKKSDSMVIIGLLMEIRELLRDVVSNQEQEAEAVELATHADNCKCGSCPQSI